MTERYELTLTDAQMDAFYRAFAIELPARMHLPYSGRRLHGHAVQLLATLAFQADADSRVFAVGVDFLEPKTLRQTVVSLAPLAKAICVAALSDDAFGQISEDGQAALRRVAEAGLFTDFP